MKLLVIACLLVVGHSLRKVRKSSGRLAMSNVKCVDTNSGAKDRWGYDCTSGGGMSYSNWPSQCGDYDTNDFSAQTMCCACGGGVDRGDGDAKYERYDKSCWDAGNDKASRDASCKGDLVCARAGHDGRNFGDCSRHHCCSTRTEPCDKTPMQGDAMQTWLAWLQNPPCEASKAAQELAARADQLVNALDYDQVPKLGDVDIVIAGSSYLDRYQVGFSMILDRVKNNVARVRRISGASSGANAPIDMMLMGEEHALTKFLTYGLLGDTFWHVHLFGIMDQSYWFKSAEWLFGKYGSQTSRMNDKMYVWMRCRGGKKVLSRFDDAGVSERAYRATGSVFPAVDVNNELKGCIDGGAGKVFDDGLHAQITVSPGKAPKASGSWRGYTLEEYADGVRRGQDAAIEFLKTHKSANNAIILCPKGASCQDPSIF